MNRLPEFITFTGVDEYTDLKRLVDISLKYNSHDKNKGLVEWGVLFGDTSNGNRYPLDWFRTIFAALPINTRKSAHLCGAYARNFLDNGCIPKSIEGFSTIQLNLSSEKYNFDRLDLLARIHNVKSIVVQARNNFYGHEARFLSQLIDASGGTGKEIKTFPKLIGSLYIHGYAGGIDKDNVIDIIENINKVNEDNKFKYYIDMESSLRDKDDKFCLDTVEEMLELVYGK